MTQLLDKIKLLTYWWLKAKFVTFPFDFHSWWLYPIMCLGAIT